MTQTPHREPWLVNFRRASRYLLAHRRPLVIGLVAALGVSIFYTFSVSSIVPVLKIIFAEHETLVDWLHRAEAEQRLGAALPADVPERPDGLPIVTVRADSPNAANLSADDRIVALGGSPGSSYDLARRIAAAPAGEITAQVGSSGGPARDVALTLRPLRWWSTYAKRAAALLPPGRTPSDRFRLLLAVMLAIVVITTLGAVFRFLNEGLVAIAVQRAMHDVRTQLADHALRLPVSWHATQPPGDTLSRFATDISKVEVGINTLFGKVIREPLKAIGVLALTILLDWRMLIIGALGLPLGILAIRSFGRMIKRAQRRASESWGRLLDLLGERLGGIRIVKAYNMQRAESRRFETEDRVLTRAQTNIELVDAGSSPALETLAAVAISAFILYGGYRVFERQLEPHLFFGAVICLGGVFDPLRKMGNVYNRLQAAEVSARRLFEVMDLPTEDQVEQAAALPKANVQPAPALADAGLLDLPPLAASIAFEDVTFAYPSNPDRPVLCGVSLTVRKGQVVALVGPNGSGKTTLISLLLRFFEPNHGRILIDGQDIARARLASLRQQIGLVTQDAVVFSGTVRENIAYGANGMTDAQIRRAAELARADSFVNALRVESDGQVTTGYDARINARTLSGGQRQRLVIARAILRDPPILILDEATSQVDSESEARIREALDDVTRNRTTFIIAHRFSTIARADLIVVLNEGRIVGEGRHDELLSTCPFYESLVRTQFAQGV
ncbi:MAG: ABC transporter transmembrane domain-containing protein [Planctomycetota bacterium]